MDGAIISDEEHALRIQKMAEMYKQLADQYGWTEKDKKLEIVVMVKTVPKSAS